MKIESENRKNVKIYDSTEYYNQLMGKYAKEYLRYNCGVNPSQFNSEVCQSWLKNMVKIENYAKLKTHIKLHEIWKGVHGGSDYAKYIVPRGGAYNIRFPSEERLRLNEGIYPIYGRAKYESDLSELLRELGPLIVPVNN